jgi:PAS domain S-box-containing protein
MRPSSTTSPAVPSCPCGYKLCSCTPPLQRTVDQNHHRGVLWDLQKWSLLCLLTRQRVFIRYRQDTASLTIYSMELGGNAELFDLLVKNANGLAIFTLDAEGRVSSWNLSAKRLLGYQEQEILGQFIDVLFTSEDRANKEPENELKTAAQVGQASDDRWIVRKDHSQFWCSGLTIALRDGELRGFAKVMRDQTDMKDALDEVTRLNQKLHETIHRLNQSQSNLQDKVRDLEKFEDAVVGRELEMIKLKRQLKDTEKELEQLRKGEGHRPQR